MSTQNPPRSGDEEQAAPPSTSRLGSTDDAKSDKAISDGYRDLLNKLDPLTVNMLSIMDKPFDFANAKPQGEWGKEEATFVDALGEGKAKLEAVLRSGWDSSMEETKKSLEKMTMDGPAWKTDIAMEIVRSLGDLSLLFNFNTENVKTEDRTAFIDKCDTICVDMLTRWKEAREQAVDARTRGHEQQISDTRTGKLRQLFSSSSNSDEGASSRSNSITSSKSERLIPSNLDRSVASLNARRPSVPVTESGLEPEDTITSASPIISTGSLFLGWLANSSRRGSSVTDYMFPRRRSVPGSHSCEMSKEERTAWSNVSKRVKEITESLDEMGVLYKRYEKLKQTGTSAESVGVSSDQG